MNVIDRFLKYVSFDTQSDPESNSCPSSAKQKLLGAELVSELSRLEIYRNFFIPPPMERIRSMELFGCPKAETPRAAKQKLLGAELVSELSRLGLQNSHMDEYGYVYAWTMERIRSMELFGCPKAETPRESFSLSTESASMRFVIMILRIF